jgi:hypothetical protein
MKKKIVKQESKENSIKGKQYNIILQYSKWCNTNKRFPVTPKDFKAIGFSEADINKEFKGGISELETIAKNRMPNQFKGIIDHRIWNSNRHSKLEEVIATHKKFVITTVVGGCQIHTRFLESIKYYCKINKAALLILVADNDISNLQDELINENIIFDDIQINNSLHISAIKILPKMIDPVTGLDRIGGKTGSFIFGSPKQRLRYVPVRNTSWIPHCIMTTGALTLPQYKGKAYYQQRTDYLAEQDHKMGAIMVEVEDEKMFHFRQIQMDNFGGFTDLGIRYTGKKELNNAEAFVLGDWHTGETDPEVRKCWLNVIKETKVKKLVVHDGFDGKSINHHNKDKILVKAKHAKEGSLSLENELIQYANELNNLEESTKVDEIIIVYSNHDRFLTTYLNACEFRHDPHNFEISLDLAKQSIKGLNAIEWFVKPRLKRPAKFTWLKQDEGRQIAGIEVGDHGDKGANGSKGTLVSLEKAQQKAVYGHSHTPQILRETYQVGTSTYLRVEYNEGPSSWCNTSCLIYKGGYRQLINSIQGKFKI